MVTAGIFGTLSVRVGGRVLGARDLGGVKPRQLFELLLVQPRAVSKDELIDSLWANKAPRDPVATLEAYVSVLRSSLQPGVHRDESLIQTLPGAYRVVRDRATIDIDRFDSLLRSLASATADERRTMLVQACGIASSPILEHERYAEWAMAPRRHYERLRLEVHVAAAEAHVDVHMTGLAMDFAERAIAIDPSCEAAYHAAMRAAGQIGRRDMVVRYYEQCVRALDRELGIAPMAATASLRELLVDERRLVGASSVVAAWSPASDGARPEPLWPLSRFG